MTEFNSRVFIDVITRFRVSIWQYLQKKFFLIMSFDIHLYLKLQVRENAYKD